MAEGVASDPRLKQVAYVVEATSFEQNVLWERFSAESMDRKIRPETRGVSWENDRGGGWQAMAGYVDKMPVTFNVNFVKINDKLVLFWEAASQVVDFRLITAWFKAHVPVYTDGSIRHCDAGNFYPSLLER